jgi:3-deoxy-D-manno-octulosonate 8-phosphate phosphatase (KDO 8-P phosphatase)
MNYKIIMKNIKCFVFDVDGVLTNNLLHITTSGELLRQMNIKDGYALKEALNQGFKICIISGGKNEGVRDRLKNLGVTDIHLGVHDKVEVLNEFCDIYNVNLDEILYMGDDIPDLYPMKKVGLPTCPQDACAEVKEISKYVSHNKGGEGAVRDVIEQVLKVQNKWIVPQPPKGE